MASVAQTPATLADANALLDDPSFTDPVGTWPSDSYVPIGGGTSGNPVTQAHWSGSAFVAGAAPHVPEDLTHQLFGEDPIPTTIIELGIHPVYGNDVLAAYQAEWFDTGTYVQLADGKAYYDSGQDGTPPAGNSTGTWISGTSPDDAPKRITGVIAGAPGDWLPSDADDPADLAYANALVAGAPGNGFTKPTATWATGEHVPFGDATTGYWDQTAGAFLTGMAP